MKQNIYYPLKDNDIIFNSHPEKQYIIDRFKDIPEKDRPRERLLRLGASFLDQEELLAIILNIGTTKEDVLAMSNRIFKAYGEKSIVNQTNPKILQKELKISELKACQIVATFELGRRFFKEVSKRQPILRNSRQVFNYLKDMRNLPKEQLRGLYLNSRYRLVHDEVISIGSLTSNIVHPREVFKPALEYSAVAIIIAHNHPSGSAKPTPEDISVTKSIAQAGRILGIDLLDHIVIAGNKFSNVPIEE